MKKALLACVFAIIPAMALSETVTKYGSVSRLDSNVGSMISIQVYSNSPSSFRATVSQNYAYNNGLTSFNRNIIFSGNSKFNITSQINNNVTQFTNTNPSVFNSFNTSFFNR